MQVKNFKGYKNYGDINFMEHGGRFIKQVDVDTYYIVTIYQDFSAGLGQWTVEHIYIDITKYTKSLRGYIKNIYGI